MSVGLAELLVLVALFGAILVAGIVMVASFFSNRRDGPEDREER